MNTLVATSMKIISFTLLLAIPITVLAEHLFVYRWLDPVDGDVHYSAAAPATKSFETIAIKHAPPTDHDLQRHLAAVDEKIDQRIDERKQRTSAARRTLCKQRKPPVMRRHQNRQWMQR